MLLFDGLQFHFARDERWDPEAKSAITKLIKANGGSLASDNHVRCLILVPLISDLSPEAAKNFKHMYHTADDDRAPVYHSTRSIPDSLPYQLVISRLWIQQCIEGDIILPMDRSWIDPESQTTPVDKELKMVGEQKRFYRWSRKIHADASSGAGKFVRAENSFDYERMSACLVSFEWERKSLKQFLLHIGMMYPEIDAKSSWNKYKTFHMASLPGHIDVKGLRDRQWTNNTLSGVRTGGTCTIEYVRACRLEGAPAKFHQLSVLPQASERTSYMSPSFQEDEEASDLRAGWDENDDLTLNRNVCTVLRDLGPWFELSRPSPPSVSAENESSFPTVRPRSSPRPEPTLTLAILRVFLAGLFLQPDANGCYTVHYTHKWQPGPRAKDGGTASTSISILPYANRHWCGVLIDGVSGSDEASIGKGGEVRTGYIGQFLSLPPGLEEKEKRSILTSLDRIWVSWTTSRRRDRMRLAGNTQDNEDLDDYHDRPTRGRYTGEDDENDGSTSWEELPTTGTRNSIHAIPPLCLHAIRAIILGKSFEEAKGYLMDEFGYDTDGKGERRANFHWETETKAYADILSMFTEGD